MAFERTDGKILDLLHKDARLVNKPLAATIGLAASSCHERIERLWAQGVITGTTTFVDPEKLAYALKAVIFDIGSFVGIV